MLEIYNEQVRDLLVKAKPQQGGLKVRQNPQKGFYVEGLKVFILCQHSISLPLTSVICGLKSDKILIFCMRKGFLSP